MAAAAQIAGSKQHLAGGSFYGSVLGRESVGGAIFPELAHSRARKLPAHSHELPFFCLFFGGDYAEKYGRRDHQFRPFTSAFRPAGVPRQHKIGPRGARMFGIEFQPSWQRGIDDCSGTLAVAYDLEGGPALWLSLKLYSETRTPLDPLDPQVDS